MAFLKRYIPHVGLVGAQKRKLKSSWAIRVFFFFFLPNSVKIKCLENHLLTREFHWLERKSEVCAVSQICGAFVCLCFHTRKGHNYGLRPLCGKVSFMNASFCLKRTHTHTRREKLSQTLDLHTFQELLYTIVSNNVDPVSHFPNGFENDTRKHQQATRICSIRGFKYSSSTITHSLSLLLHAPIYPDSIWLEGLGLSWLHHTLPIPFSVSAL